MPSSGGVLGERGQRKGPEGCTGGVESDDLCFLCAEKLKVSAESEGEGS